eukprot:IDg2168t1
MCPRTRTHAFFFSGARHSAVFKVARAYYACASHSEGAKVGVRGDVRDRVGIGMFWGMCSGVLGDLLEGVRDGGLGASRSRAPGTAIVQPQKRRRSMWVSWGRCTGREADWVQSL